MFLPWDVDHNQKAPEVYTYVSVVFWPSVSFTFEVFTPSIFLSSENEKTIFGFHC